MMVLGFGFGATIVLFVYLGCGLWVLRGLGWFVIAIVLCLCGAGCLLLGLKSMGFHRGNETFLMKEERWVVGRKGGRWRWRKKRNILRIFHLISSFYNGC